MPEPVRNSGWYLLLLLLPAVAGLPAAAQAQDPEPAIELLEFLGEWETDNGEWIDPDELEDRAYAGLGRAEETVTEDDE